MIRVQLDLCIDPTAGRLFELRNWYKQSKSSLFI
jgi:hypothetical protein